MLSIHTGEEVVLYSYLPGNQRITGVVDNTDIADIISDKLGFNLSDLSAKLFVPARAAFEAKGATIALDNQDKANPAIMVTKGSDNLRLPINKNIAILNGKTINLEGLVVYNGKTAYVPQQTINLIK
jgi:alkaline phosphatase